MCTRKERLLSFIRRTAAENQKDLDTVTVLLVEDRPSELEGYKGNLEDIPGTEIITATTLDEALKHAEETRKPMVVVTDVNLPDGESGTELCYILTHLPGFRGVVVCISGSGDPDLNERASRSGASWFMQKPVDVALLREYVQTAVMAVRRLVIKGASDRKTGFPIDTHFEYMMSRELDRALGEQKKVSLLFVDVDRFKSINDTYGHLVGDKVLEAIGARISNHLRSTDTPLRKGDEFLVILPDADDITASEKAMQIEQTIGTHPVHYGDKSVPVNVSVGWATLQPEQIVDYIAAGFTLEEIGKKLVDDADKHMYLHKEEKKRAKKNEFATKEVRRSGDTILRPETVLTKFKSFVDRALHGELH